jgi:hypothetical protein
MALSGIVDQTETAGSVCEGALRKLGVVDGQEQIAQNDAMIALMNLKRMLRTWAVTGIRLWLDEVQTVGLVGGVSTYALPDRVIDVHGAYLRQGGVDIPLRILMREEYERYPDKSVTGSPIAVYINRKLASTEVTAYPVPAASGDTLRVLCKRQIQDVTAITQEMEFPPEWSECVLYNLAVRCAPDYGISAPAEVVALSLSLFEDLQAHDREGRVAFRTGG